MASVTEPGILRVYAVSPTGQRFQTHMFQNGGAISAGGSPDGVLANVTEDKHMFIPKSALKLYGGWKVVLTLEMAAADGLSYADSRIQLPITVKGEGVQWLTVAKLAWTVDIAAATAADIEVQLGKGYEIPLGKVAKIGGAKGVISIEDDTA